MISVEQFGMKMLLSALLLSRYMSILQRVVMVPAESMMCRCRRRVRGGVCLTTAYQKVVAEAHSLGQRVLAGDGVDFRDVWLPLMECAILLRIFLDAVGAGR